MDSYIPRIVDAQLGEYVAGLPAVAVQGPKSIGKTTSVLRLAASVLRLDDPATLEIVRADPARAIALATPVLIDEWQRYPPIFDAIRRAVDSDSRPGQYILTGSSLPKNAPAHSGAGRVVSVRMRPLSFAERQLVDPEVSLAELLVGAPPKIGGQSAIDLEQYTDEILAGGFPNLRARPSHLRAAALREYLDLMATKELKDSGHFVRAPASMGEWIRAYAGATATNATWETIRDAATPGRANPVSRQTADRYRDALADSWVLDPLPAWRPGFNHLARPGAAPKHHLADPALAAAAVRLSKAALLGGQQPAGGVRRDGAFLGALFESLVALSVRVYAQAAKAEVSHYREGRGRTEIDLIIEREDGAFIAMEAKLAAAIDDDDVRHLVAMKKQVGDEMLAGVVINTGTTMYRRQDGIYVVPLSLLGP